ncbi:acyl-CoA dehydrogenase family protein [Luteitalea sp.]|uniref:acyl-CoA dehydrogenase family protein n=1 Tax=Luteitalea sp. TaxID=2004800 RepID=UPI0025C0FB3B|nr:acyl-CoA dehydrogenase family protein [Luteitalea sp.]
MSVIELTEEQLKLQKAAIAFARESLTSNMVARDRESHFDRDAWRRCADFGVLGMPIPQEYGGLGLGLTELLAVMEGLGRGTRDQGLLFSLNAHLWTNPIPILLYGTAEQRQKYLPPLCDGTLIGANAASEPDSGSDVFSMRTRATREGDFYVLNGSKTFVSNAPVADLFVAYATVNPALGSMGITGFIVERDTPGLTVSPHLEKMGLRTSPMAEVIFDNCRIPVSQRLGREGRGVAVFECSMEWERGCILASCLGVMERQLEDCLAHARARKQFGKSIGKFQSVANRLVDMRVRIDTCRPLIYRIGVLKDRGVDATTEAAIAKLYVSESYVKSCLDAVQIFGGYGYMTEQQVERDLRDSVSSTLYSGTSEIQRNIIAKGLGL